MMAKRTLAFLAAVALIVAAILIRQQLDSPAETAGSAGSGNDNGGNADQRLTAVCSTELEPACAAADLDIAAVEDPQVTADRISVEGGRLGASVWIVSDPWPEIVAEARTAAGLDAGPAGAESTVVATTGLAVVARQDRIDALTANCGGPVDLRCIGDRAGAPWSTIGGQAGWGSLTIGIDDTATTAGLVTLGAFGVAWFGGTQFASNDIDLDDDFAAWFDRLANAVPGSGPGGTTFLDRFLNIPATASMVTALSGPAAKRVEASRSADQLTVLPVTPPVAVRAQVIGTSGDRSRVDAGKLRRALADLGWEAGSAGAASGLPRAGVLSALASRWTA